jgi:hypothetical protein
MIRARRSTVLFLLWLPTLAWSAEPFRYQEGKHAQGELKYYNGLPVLSVAGTPEEIGEQIGVLTAQPMQRLVQFPAEALKSAGVGFLMPQLSRLSQAMLPHFPPDYRKELETMARHAGLDLRLGVIGNTMPDILKLAGCATLIVEPDRSDVQGPLFGRNLDYPTFGFLQEYSLVSVYRPKGKHAFAAIGFPGMVGCLTGINDAGLTIATLEVYVSKDGSPRFNPTGVPYTLCYRRILEECTTVAEAERLLRSVKRTTMNNLAVCDKVGGAVLEISPKSVVVRRPVDHLCACTNHFRTDAMGVAGAMRCRRYDILDQSSRLPKLGLADVARKLHATNQGIHTMQTMIFEPASLRLHLAIGETPSSALPLQVLDLAPFLAAK